VRSLLAFASSVRVGGCEGRRRPPWSPTRESRRFVMIRNAFDRQEPFVGSGGPYSPGPATTAPLLTMRRPLDDDHSPPWVWRRSSPVFTGEADSRQSFRSTRSPTVPPADSRPALDPRSLDPAALFGARLPSLFEVRRRLPTSATALRRAGNQTRAHLILAGTKASTFFLFFSASRCLPCESGEAWRAALRPFAKAPVLVPPSYPGLPNRDAFTHAPPPRLAPAEHSED